MPFPIVPFAKPLLYQTNLMDADELESRLNHWTDCSVFNSGITWSGIAHVRHAHLSQY